MIDDSNMWRKVLKGVSALKNEVALEMKVSNKANGLLKGRASDSDPDTPK
jgi:hypothetical protein